MTVSPLVELPTEVLLHVLQYLQVQETLKLRETCHSLANVTRAKSLWLDILKRLSHSVPLPNHLKNPSAQYVLDLSAGATENAAKLAWRTNVDWHTFRTKEPVKLDSVGAKSIIGLDVFDNWLLTCYSEGIVCLWDLDRVNYGQCEMLDVGSTHWSSHACAWDSERGRLLLALSKSAGQPMTLLYSISFKDSKRRNRHFELLHSIPSSTPQMVRAIDAKNNIIALSRSPYVELIKCHDDGSHSTFRFSTQAEDLEELWNGIVALELIGSYVAVIKTRSVEIYDAFSTESSDSQPTPVNLPVLRHTLSNTTFRNVSFSSRRCTSIPPDADDQPIFNIVQFEFFGYDVLQGIFHYSVEGYVPSDRSVNKNISGSLDVELLAVYPMANAIRTLGKTKPLAQMPYGCPLISTGVSSPLRSPLDVVDATTALAADLVGLTLSGAPTSNVTTRGFISTFCLGPEGQRALWVERNRGSTVREIVIWSRYQQCKSANACLLPDSTLVTRIDAKKIWNVKSYDLRADITHCAFNEVTGQIVLGNRAGEVFVLNTT